MNLFVFDCFWEWRIQNLISLNKIVVKIDEMYLNHKAFAYTKKIISQIFPDVIPAPYILPAGTDARHLCEICDCVIRFAPIEMNDEQLASVHSENEHISLESIANSVVFYKEYLKNYK